MVKFAYKENGEVVEKEFNSYPEMVLFVAQNNIKDEDFESLEMPEMSITGGIEGLKQVAIEKSQEAIERQKEADEIDELMARVDDINFEIENGDPDPSLFEEREYILDQLAAKGIYTNEDEFGDECDECNF